MRYSGVIGVSGVVEEVSPGIWKPSIVEYNVVGTISTHTTTWVSDTTPHGSLKANHTIRLVAPEYVNDWGVNVLYATWMNAKWSVISIKSEYPHIELTLGGKYNG